MTDLRNQKCNMDQNSPDHYREENVAISIQNTKDLVSYIRSLGSELVQPILTPRFAITCTSELLQELGTMMKADPLLALQTHISENKGEIQFTKDLFPDQSSYADVYDHHGLLCEKTILAHAVHLEESEIELIRKRGSGVSHCPTSNFNLRSGMARIGELIDRGIKASAYAA
jgi:guanine deaminase